eukprot:7029939-Alexandrium_andersonii.AAC.1
MTCRLGLCRRCFIAQRWSRNARRGPLRPESHLLVPRDCGPPSGAPAPVFQPRRGVMADDSDTLLR